MKGNISKKKGFESDITQANLDYIAAKAADSILPQHIKEVLNDSVLYETTELWRDVQLELDTIYKKSETYTSEEVDSKLALKTDKSDTYTKAEVDNAFDEVYLKTQTYSKDEINTQLSQKQNTLTIDTTPTPASTNPISSNAVYALQVNLGVDIIDIQLNKADKAEITELQEELGFKADKSEVYTKDETDIRLGDKVDKQEEFGLVKGEVTDINEEIGSQTANLYFSDGLTGSYIGSVPNASFVEVMIASMIKNKADKIKSIPHTTATGYPATLTDHLADEQLISCKVFGTAGGVGDLVTSGEYAGKYKIPVKVEGKNLLDYSKFSNINNYIGRSPTNATKEVFGIGFPPGTYTISWNQLTTISEKSISCGYFLGDGSNIIGIINLMDYKTPIGKNSKTFTSGTDWYLRFYYSGNNNTQAKLDTFLSEFADFQIERGSASTAYEPYITPSEAIVYLNNPLMEDQYTSIQGLQTVDSTINTITTDTLTKPAKIDVTYYQDINKVVTQIKNAILANGGNV